LDTEPEASIARAAKVLRGGGLVAFPTETVYGLGAVATDPAAVARIFAAKGRAATNPVIVHVSDIASTRALVRAWPPQAQRLAEQFWPGPLTLVLPKADVVPEIVTAGGPTVGLRVPAHPLALALVRTTERPIAAPSANRSQRISPTTAAHVLKQLAGRIEMVIDGGAAPGGLESTVIDLSGEIPRLLRPGMVTRTELETALGEPVLVGPLAAEVGEVARSPGLETRHYAPQVPLVLIEGGNTQLVEQYCRSNRLIGWLPLGSDRGLTLPNLQTLVLPSGPREYGASLYAALHQLEDAGVARILVELPPDSPVWQAVRDRLRRGAVDNG
jgi:L-threonylcarbamoyladenylate synthase